MKTNQEYFSLGSKVVFVSGGYQGGIERVGYVTRVYRTYDMLVTIVFPATPETPECIESFECEALRLKIERGRTPGSLAQVRMITPKEEVALKEYFPIGAKITFASKNSTKVITVSDVDEERVQVTDGVEFDYYRTATLKAMIEGSRVLADTKVTIERAVLC